MDRAVTGMTFDRATVSRVAHYQAESLKEGGMPGFVEMCSELVANDAVRSLSATIMRNKARDKGKGVRFTHVTSGRNNCAWCLMLAGGGPCTTRASRPARLASSTGTATARLCRTTREIGTPSSSRGTIRKDRGLPQGRRAPHRREARSGARLRSATRTGSLVTRPRPTTRSTRWRITGT